MWSAFLTSYILTYALSKNIILENNTSTSMFHEQQIIFSAGFNISRILVPADGNKYLQPDTSEIPSVFFTVVDPKLEGGSCIYVLEGFVSFEILEGGRDTTADYSFDNTIYFGAKDGLYKYHPDSLSAKKYGLFRDDIIQLQKANGTDEIYILTADNKIYKIERNGTVKTRISDVVCATEFVLDTSNNLYYVSCDLKMLNIVRRDGAVINLANSILIEVKDLVLLRPAFVMEESIPILGDGFLYIVNSNGSCDKKDFYINDKPSALSIDTALYVVAALKGKIYEFNVMDVLLRSMFGVSSEWPRDITKIIMLIIENTRDGLFEFYRNLSKPDDI
ncbi:hypothetical protein K1T71_013963 [Dendrolimus kikuchii]|uniref:Uncharacterized protein n=1 Tax=Dendrolimus kikuchii TaxID=765133 RepID=A0ACC1CGI7_9NEOP|nr:hypothetical protein K1T71_013963 [Dendrolimus kikuchii]